MLLVVVMFVLCRGIGCPRSLVLLLRLYVLCSGRRGAGLRAALLCHYRQGQGEHDERSEGGSQYLLEIQWVLLSFDDQVAMIRE
jgi:cytochrome c